MTTLTDEVYTQLKAPPRQRNGADLIISDIMQMMFVITVFLGGVLCGLAL